jgi:hypothetical protein
MNTAVKKAAREELIAALDKDASYVDMECNGYLVILLSAGYLSVNTNRAQNVLEEPQIVAVDYGQTGELKLRVKADPKAKSFMRATNS